MSFVISVEAQYEAWKEEDERELEVLENGASE